MRTEGLGKYVWWGVSRELGLRVAHCGASEAIQGEDEEEAWRVARRSARTILLAVDPRVVSFCGTDHGSPNRSDIYSPDAAAGRLSSAFT